MDQYIGLDVSLKDTAISIREDGKRIWRGKCASDPKLLAQTIRKHAPHAKRVVFETGLELPPKDRTCSGLRLRADELARRLIS
ncbi:hypothetical protein J2W42_006675 [Rhizobium tibeticum]|nr:hypothetical protein [Rhizobium tibeticum]